MDTSCAEGGIIRDVPLPEQERKSKVRLPYGWSPDRNRLLHVSEVSSGLACRCVCPGCGTPLVARMGRQRAAHFAHHAPTSCTGAYETMLHLLAKQVIAERRLVMLPPVQAGHGGVKVLKARAREFRPDEVVLEQGMDGIRPDIVASVQAPSGTKRLLVEVAVTHFCGPEKVALIQDRKLACIEIDLSKLPRNAPREEMEAAILTTAPRHWIYNEVAARENERLRQEAERRAEREEAEAARRTRAAAQRVVADFRTRTAIRRSGGTREQRMHLARCADAGWGEHEGIPVLGAQAHMAVQDRVWQAAILDIFLLRKSGIRQSSFYPSQALRTLRDSGFLKPGAPPAWKDDQVTAAARSLDPDYRTSGEVVEAYLAHLVTRGLLIPLPHGDFATNETRASQARARIRDAEESRARVADLKVRVEELIGMLPPGRQSRVDTALWLRTSLPGRPETPAGLAAGGGLPHSSLMAKLDRLKLLLRPGTAIEEDLLGLPLESELEARRLERAAAEERTRLEREEHQRAEAARERQEEEIRRRRLVQRAITQLGEEGAAAWLATPTRLLDGQAPANATGLADHHFIWLDQALDEESRRLGRQEAAAARAEEWRERMREHVAAHTDRGYAEFWMRSANARLGMARPSSVCVDEAGFARCREAFGADARHPRRR
ncbi:competence protein CoiA family protein [Indioceanicola profundi]|uniref:competence protein CoiA family protein n=1 Tax=Indioceanicola profundi TaxID=2220096 RepID=UPI000E6AB099|nr:competence protein CoiA family protein [Indioceanicola profundi]